MYATTSTRSSGREAAVQVVGQLHQRRRGGAARRELRPGRAEQPGNLARPSGQSGGTARIAGRAQVGNDGADRHRAADGGHAAATSSRLATATCTAGPRRTHRTSPAASSHAPSAAASTETSARRTGSVPRRNHPFNSNHDHHDRGHPVDVVPGGRIAPAQHPHQAQRRRGERQREKQVVHERHGVLRAEHAGREPGPEQRHRLEGFRPRRRVPAARRRATAGGRCFACRPRADRLPGAAAAPATRRSARTRRLHRSTARVAAACRCRRTSRPHRAAPAAASAP